MIKINKHIEIVSSTAHGLSSMSQISRDAILKVLSSHYTKVGITIVNNLTDLEKLVLLKPDIVFLGMKFIPEDETLGMNDPSKIWLANYLTENDIAYTGSNHLSHELELNKPLAKQRVLDAGFSTSPYFVIKQHQPVHAGSLPIKFPLFIKPTNRGGGLGIDSNSVVHNLEALASKVHSITTEHQSDSLVEQYLPGREFSVALLRHEYSPEYMAMPLELIAPPDEFGERLLSARVKSADAESFIEVKDHVLRSKVTNLALDVFSALGARDYGRIDIRLDQNGTAHFLEANLIPSLLDGYGNFPKACKLNKNLDYADMLLHIVRLGLARSDTADMGAFEPEESLIPALPLPLAV